VGSIYLRGNKYWVKYTHHGKTYRESSQSDKITDARRLLKQREGESVEERFPGLKAQKTMFKELTEDYLMDYKKNKYKSFFRAEISVRHLLGFFETYNANDIDTRAINEYVAKRLDENAANGTVNRELAALRRMYSIATKSTPPKVLRAPRIEMLEENNVRAGYFEPQDYIHMRENLPAHLRPLFAAAYFTGLRKSELTSLTWDQVNLFQRKITLDPGTTKNNEPRIIWLAGELLEIMKEQYARTMKGFPKCRYVFHKDGNRIADFRKAWQRALLKCGYKPSFKCRDCGAIVQLDLEQKWKKEGPLVSLRVDKKTWQELICERCGQNRFQRNSKVFHDNRRTAVRNMVRTGTPESVAMKISGHKTRTIFERYNITSEEDQKAASERLSNTHEEALKELQNFEVGHNLGTISLVK